MVLILVRPYLATMQYSSQVPTFTKASKKSRLTINKYSSNLHTTRNL